jgi:hypothetical protein
MKDIEYKDTGFWYDFKEGRLLRFSGVLLPPALYFYLSNKYGFSLESTQIFLSVYLLVHGLWIYFSKTFPIFTQVGLTNATIIIKGRIALIFAIILIIAGLVFLGISLT